MISLHRLRKLLAALAIGASLIGSAQAALFTEIPDAGQTIGAANNATVVSPPTSIRGRLSNEPSPLDWVDMYRLSIPTGARFYANTGPGTDPALIADPVLFLFDGLGMGIAMDDESGGFGQASLSTGVLGGGIYFLAIAFAGLEPLDTNGDPMFDVFGAGGLLSSLSLGSWFGVPFAGDPSTEGRYLIASHYVPLPGTLALVVLGFVALRATHKSRSRHA